MAAAPKPNIQIDPNPRKRPGPPARIIDNKPATVAVPSRRIRSTRPRGK
jgi:hypothetical protein